MVRWRGIFTVVFFVPFLGLACGDDSEGPGSSAGSGGAGAGKGGQAGAGRGGSSGGGAGGTSGRGGNASVAGEGGAAGSFSGAGGAGGDGGAASCTCDGEDCTSTLDAFCPFKRALECPIELERALHPAGICELDATEARYSECGSGRIAFEWVEGFENHYKLVFGEDGAFVYGSAFGYVSAGCADAMNPNEDNSVEAGSSVSLSNCRSCDFCAAVENASGAAGAGGVGSGGAGAGGESGEGALPPCAIDEDGRISLPE